jgi:hypothetical protein
MRSINSALSSSTENFEQQAKMREIVRLRGDEESIFEKNVGKTL